MNDFMIMLQGKSFRKAVYIFIFFVVGGGLCFATIGSPNDLEGFLRFALGGMLLCSPIVLLGLVAFGLITHTNVPSPKVQSKRKNKQKDHLQEE